MAQHTHPGPGGGLLVGAQFIVRVGDERPLSPAEVEAPARQQAGPSAGVGRKSVYHDQSFAAMKPWRSV